MMGLMRAIFTFYAISFGGLYFSTVFFSTENGLGEYVSESFSGNNGVEGFLYLWGGVSVLGLCMLVLSMANKELEVKILNVIKEGGKGSFLKALKLMFFGDK